MTRKDNYKIYTTHGDAKCIAYRGRVNGVMALIYCKNDEVVGYIPLEELMRELYAKPCKDFCVAF